MSEITKPAKAQLVDETKRNERDDIVVLPAADATEVVDAGAVAPPRTIADRFGVLIALLSIYVIWGSTYFAIRIAVAPGGWPPYLMAGTRFIIAGVVLFVAMRLRGAPNPTRAQWLGATAVGGFLLLGGNGGVTFAEQYVASGLASLAVATVPLWAALFAGLWGHWPNRREWIGLGIGFVGIVLLNTNKDMQANPLGAIVLIIAPMSWAFGTVLSRRVPLPKGLMTSAVEMLGGGVLLTLAGLVFGEHFNAIPNPDALWAWAYLIGFGSLVGFTAYDYLLRRVRPALATSYAYVNPPVAVLLGMLFLSEPFTLNGLFAMLIILSGVVLIMLGQRPKQANLQPD